MVTPKTMRRHQMPKSKSLADGWRANRILPLAIVHALGLTLAAPVAAQILPTSMRAEVDSSLDPGNPSTCTLRQAISSVTAGSPVGSCQLSLVVGRFNLITFDPAILPTTITLNGSSLLIESDISINGPGRDQLTISGNDQSSIFEADTGTLSLSSLSLTRGYGTTLNSGGAIRATSDLRLSDVSIDRSSADYGGCLFGSAVTTIDDSSLSRCSATRYGGGLFLSGSGELTVSNTTISENTALFAGGGLYLIGDSTVINDSNLSENVAGGPYTGQGGAIAFYGSTVTLRRSQLINNRADGSGSSIQGRAGNYAESAIEIDQTLITDLLSNTDFSIDLNLSPAATDTIVIGNSTLVGARGTRLNANIALVENSTLQSSAAAGLRLRPTARVRLSNTIVAGSPGDDCIDDGAIFLENSHNLFGDGNCTANGENLVFADPLLGPLQDNGGTTLTLALLPGSPAINAGNMLCRPVDQRGFDRNDGQCDIGAYEAGASDLMFADGFEAI